jgi:hypothetical protein
MLAISFLLWAYRLIGRWKGRKEERGEEKEVGNRE